MPHITIECSRNVGKFVDLDELVARVHNAALQTGVFPVGGTRTRLFEAEHYRIADGDADNAFVHLALRIGHGRDLAVKRSAAAKIFEELCAALQPLEKRPLAISLEVTEIDPELSFKKNNLHDFVEERRTARAR